MSYLCGIGYYICSFPKSQPPSKYTVNAVPKEITEKEIFAGFGVTADSKQNIASNTSDLKDPYGIEILKAFGAII